jgi:hypothetical protein
MCLGLAISDTFWSPNLDPYYSPSPLNKPLIPLLITPLKMSLILLFEFIPKTSKPSNSSPAAALVCAEEWCYLYILSNYTVQYSGEGSSWGPGRIASASADFPIYCTVYSTVVIRGYFVPCSVGDTYRSSHGVEIKHHQIYQRLTMSPKIELASFFLV